MRARKSSRTAKSAVQRPRYRSQVQVDRKKESKKQGPSGDAYRWGDDLVSLTSGVCSSAG